VIPRFSFLEGEGRLLSIVLWLMSALFLGIMVVAWIAAERARPVLLDLETGKPVTERPAL
jgi:hypothetical protein